MCFGEEEEEKNKIIIIIIIIKWKQSYPPTTSMNCMAFELTEFQELTARNECRIILHSITVRIDDTTESKGFSLSCSLPDKTLH